MLYASETNEMTTEFMSHILSTGNHGLFTKLPRDIVISEDAILQMPTICADVHPGRRVLLITGEKTGRVAGELVYQRLKEANSYTISIFCASSLSPQTIEAAKEAAHDVDYLIAIGGGRVIDTAKIVSFRAEKPFISVPTAASHDGIVSNRATLPTDTGSVSIQAAPPIAVIADTTIIAEAPHRLLASGCADIISNYTAILDWEFANRLRGEEISEYAIALSKMTAETLVKQSPLIKPKCPDAARIVVEALVFSGIAMSIAGSSRPASGGEHKFGHALEKIAPGKALHGEACGIGSIMTMYLHNGDWRSIRESLQKIGAPTTPQEIGVSDEQIACALLEAKTIRPERYTILDTHLTRESAQRLVSILYHE
jgi:glycerol-1-phosphate dehydrogenase [NAD(P)+]